MTGGTGANSVSLRDQMKKRPHGGVMILVPSIDGRPYLDFMYGLLRSRHLYDDLFFVRGQSNIALARNVLASTFLRSPYQTAIFLDQDIQFNEAHLAALLSHPENLVSIPYAKKNESLEPVTLGFGMVKVTRAVLERMATRTVAFEFEGDNLHDFFMNGATGNGKWMNEDIGFFHLASEAGITLHHIHDARIGHIGSKTYYLDNQLAPLDATQTAGYFVG